MEILRWKEIAGAGAFHAARDTKLEGRPLREHGHDFAEVFWIDGGRGTHRINGRATPLQPGSLVMIRPEDRHGIVPAPGEAIRLTNIAFPRPILEALGQNYFLRKPVFFWSRQFVPFAGEVGPGRLRRLNGWADELAQSSRHRLPIDRFLLNLFAELSSDRDQAMPGDAPGWLVRACGKIRAPEQFAQGVGGFLRLCGRSREHVARTVRRYLRTTPTGYVNQVRMNHARRQLEMGDREIIEIALECGIENLSHFYALFRRETGTTPRAYRLDHRRSL